MKNRLLHVFYPVSGERLTFYGRTVHDTPGGQLVMAIILAKGMTLRGEHLDAGNAVILDPRCVVVDPRKGVVHSPRSCPPELFTPGLVDWLDEHPEWPP